MERSCKTCEFVGRGEKSRESYDIKVGKHTVYTTWYECRKHAPRIFHGSGEGWSGQKFPEMEPNDWCGEWEPKGEEENGYNITSFRETS